jgi:hypothetical protein
VQNANKNLYATVRDMTAGALKSPTLDWMKQKNMMIVCANNV